jgi:hypothetical protein
MRDFEQRQVLSMPPLNWGEGGPPSHSPAFLPVERFLLLTARYRVWFLGDIMSLWVHYTPETGTKPCTRPHEPCKFCDSADPKETKVKEEGYAPVLFYKLKKGPKEWLPVVGVFTHAAVKFLGYNNLRGRMFDLARERQGGAKLMKLVEVAQGEDGERRMPADPPFNVCPHLLKEWNPNDQIEPPADTPVAGPRPVADDEFAFKPQVATLAGMIKQSGTDPAALQRLRLFVQNGCKEETRAAAPAAAPSPEPTPPPASPPPPPPSPLTPPAPVAAAEPVPTPTVVMAPAAPPPTRPAGGKPAMTPSPEKAMEAHRRRTAQKKPDEPITFGDAAEEAIRNNGILKFLAPNGLPKKQPNGVHTPVGAEGGTP